MDKEVDKEETKKYCQKCNIEITSKRRKVFCSKKCAVAFHALKRYHKIKSSPEYKQQRDNYLKNKKKKEVAT
jgi:hypothetical protein